MVTHEVAKVYGRTERRCRESIKEELTESYDGEIFSNKIKVIFTHIVDQALMGFNWVA